MKGEKVSISLQKVLYISCAARTLQHTCKWKAHATHLELSTLTFITNARTTMPFARLHSQMVCTQSEPAEIPQHMFVQILVQVGGDRKRRTSRTTLRTPTPLVIRHSFLVYCARTWKTSFPPYLQISETQIANELLHGNCVALSIFCLNIALLCIPLNAFETWADQQELSKEARCKSAFSSRRRVSLLESSMLLYHLMEARNQENCKGSWPHSLSTAQFVVLFFTPRMRLKEHRCLF